MVVDNMDVSENLHKVIEFHVKQSIALISPRIIEEQFELIQFKLEEYGIIFAVVLPPFFFAPLVS